jgi:hypothetical protein
LFGLTNPHLTGKIGKTKAIFAQEKTKSEARRKLSGMMPETANAWLK